jgi:hypothetical protein
MLPRRERNHQPWRDAGASLRTALALETLVHLVAGIDANRQHADLSSGEARTRSRQKYQMQEHYWIICAHKPNRLNRILLMIAITLSGIIGERNTQPNLLPAYPCHQGTLPV